MYGGCSLGIYHNDLIIFHYSDAGVAPLRPGWMLTRYSWLSSSAPSCSLSSATSPSTCRLFEGASLHINGSSGHPKIGKRVSSIATNIKDLWPAQPVRCVCSATCATTPCQDWSPPSATRRSCTPGGLHPHSRILLPVGFHRHFRFP